VAALESFEWAHCKVADKIEVLPITSVTDHLVEVSVSCCRHQASLANAPYAIVLDIDRVPAVDEEAPPELRFGAALPRPSLCAVFVCGGDSRQAYRKS
jgi:hypothetical protein